MEEAYVEDSLTEDMRMEGKMAEDMKTDAMEDNSEGSWSENRWIVDAPMEDGYYLRGSNAVEDCRYCRRTTNEVDGCPGWWDLTLSPGETQTGNEA
jgi:hypothetical protein